MRQARRCETQPGQVSSRREATDSESSIQEILPKHPKRSRKGENSRFRRECRSIGSSEARFSGRCPPAWESEKSETLGVQPPQSAYNRYSIRRGADSTDFEPDTTLAAFSAGHPPMAGTKEVDSTRRSTTSITTSTSIFRSRRRGGTSRPPRSSRTLTTGVAAFVGYLFCSWSAISGSRRGIQRLVADGALWWWWCWHGSDSRPTGRAAARPPSPSPLCGADAGNGGPETFRATC